MTYVYTAIIQPSTLAHPEFGADFFDLVIWNGARTVIIGCLGAVDRSFLEDVAQMGKVGNDLLNSQRSDDIDQCFEIFLTWERKHENLRTFRFRHQPQSLM
jgi:hypothetical protein